MCYLKGKVFVKSEKKEGQDNSDKQKKIYGKVTQINLCVKSFMHDNLGGGKKGN